MPSPDKDRPSGRLGRLLAGLRPSRAGPLPVQTGFPTSLADLVVKNHGRLKKQPSPSSRRRKGGVSASPSPSTSPSPPPSSPPPPSAAAAVSPSDRPRPDLSPAPAVRRDKSGAFGLGLGFLALGGVVSLALLVIWSKKVVAAVTVAAFSLFLLESLRCSSRLPRRPPTDGQLYLAGRGRVSPIREVEAEETEPSRAGSFSDSERGLEVEVSSSLLSSAAEVKSGALEESSNNPIRAKTKRRAWKKLIANAKKLHRGRKSKEPAGDSRSGSFRSEGGDAASGSVRSNSNVRDSSGSRRGTWAYEMDLIADAIDSDAPADLPGEEEEPQQRRREGNEKACGVRFPALVLVAVALVGLVAGKLPAVGFTMLCAAFSSWVPRLRRGGDWSRWRRSERPVL